MRRVLERSPLLLLSGLLASYLAIPLVAFVIRLAASNNRGFASVGLFPALWVSLATATASLVLVSVLGVPLAYLLARHDGRLARVVGVVVQLPLALPPVMSGILLMYLVGPNTALGRLVPNLTDSPAGIVLAQSFVAAPFLLVAARAAFAGVDAGHLDVAATLGHRELARFFRVAVPEAAPGLRAGMLLCWLRAFGEYGATVILAYHPFSVPVYTFNQFSITGLPTTEAPTALALGAAALALFVSRAPIGRLGRVLRRRRAGVGAGRRGLAVKGVDGGARSPQRLGFSVAVRAGDFSLEAQYAGSGRLAVLGPSGAGKSTLLASLAGLRAGGEIRLTLGEEALSDQPTPARRVGYLPQNFSLFSRLRVAEQVTFGVGADHQLAAQWCERLGLGGLENRLPTELSGGERQRVGLAQALARAPALLLLDEPFAALDVPVRRELRGELRTLQRVAGVSSVVVTHDPEEAALLGDELVVLAHGRVLQSGRVDHVFAYPASRTVAQLLGIENFGAARVASLDVLHIGDGIIGARTGDLVPGTAVHWSVPGEAVTVLPLGGGATTSGVVADVAELGSAIAVLVSLGGGATLRSRQYRRPGLRVGAPCDVVVDPDALRVWAAPSSTVDGGAPEAL